VIGKPNKLFFQTAIGAIEPNKCVMIGDDYKDDVLGAENAGITGILVKTGKYRLGDEAHVKLSYDDLSAAVDAILAHNSLY